jgi:hypothetical protein
MRVGEAQRAAAGATVLTLALLLGAAGAAVACAHEAGAAAAAAARSAQKAPPPPPRRLLTLAALQRIAALRRDWERLKAAVMHLLGRSRQARLAAARRRSSVGAAQLFTAGKPNAPPAGPPLR